MCILGSFPVADSCVLRFAIFDGSLALNVNTGEKGPVGEFFNHLLDHAFVIGQMDFTWGSDYVGILSLGGWGHSALLETFDGNLKKGTIGPYLTYDQIFYKNKEREYSLFAFYGYADPTLNNVMHYAAYGLNFKGLLEERPNDHIGFSIDYSHFTPFNGYSNSFESHIELFYQYNYNKAIYILPDYQYVIHPGGMGLPNASVFTLRLDLIL